MTLLIVSLVLWSALAFMGGRFAHLFCRHYKPTLSKWLAFSTLFTIGAALLLAAHGLGLAVSPNIYPPLANAGSVALLGTTYLILSVADQLRKQDK